MNTLEARPRSEDPQTASGPRRTASEAPPTAEAAWVPGPVQELLKVALVGELTAIRPDGRPVTYPLIPLWDGTRIYMTSSVLFSRKLEHIKRNPRVAVSLTDPIALGGLHGRATIQGDARIVEDDPHADWERILPIWRAKEPAIEAFYKERVALPLFFERSLIEIAPRRVLYWPDGRTDRAPRVSEPPAAEA
jgi:general stress protein 26